jgi:hypothetical protein
MKAIRVVPKAKYFAGETVATPRYVAAECVARARVAMEYAVRLTSQSVAVASAGLNVTGAVARSLPAGMCAVRRQMRTQIPLAVRMSITAAVTVTVIRPLAEQVPIPAIHIIRVQKTQGLGITDSTKQSTFSCPANVDHLVWLGDLLTRAGSVKTD